MNAGRPSPQDAGTARSVVPSRLPNAGHVSFLTGPIRGGGIVIDGGNGKRSGTGSGKVCSPRIVEKFLTSGKNGTIHLADITTPTGIIIKVRQATLRDTERRAREAFYTNLLWIIDGRGFRHNFDVYHALPHPHSAVARDIVWLKARRDIEDSTDGAFYRLSAIRRAHPDTAVTKATFSALGAPAHAHGLDAIRTDVDQSYCGHHQYDWIRPRQVWLDSPCPVFIDFGDAHLVKLEIYDASGLPCIRYVDKRTLVRDAMRETDARAIGTG